MAKRRKPPRRGRPDKFKYDDKERVNKAKAAMRRLSSHDLAGLRWWCSNEASRASAREREAAGLAFMDSLKVGDRIMLDPNKVAMTSDRTQPGEGFDVLQIHRGRKHVGVFLTNERIAEGAKRRRERYVWLTPGRLADFKRHEPNELEGCAADTERRMRAFTKGLNDVAADMLGGKGGSDGET